MRPALFVAALAVTTGCGGLIALAGGALHVAPKLALWGGAFGLAWAVVVMIADHAEHVGIRRGRAEADAQWRKVRS